MSDTALRCMVHHPHIEHQTQRQDEGGGGLLIDSVVRSLVLHARALG
jgi:hypothetical protein